MIINGINLTFEFSSLILYLICLITYFLRPHWPSPYTKWFFRVLLFGTLCVIINLLSILVPEVVLFNGLINSVRFLKVLYFFLISVSYAYLYRFFYYRYRFKANVKLMHNVHHLGLGLIGFFCLIGIFTDFMFKNNDYFTVYGLGQYLSFGVLGFFVLLIIFYTVRSWKELTKVKKISIIFFILIQVLGFTIQHFFQKVLFIDFSIATYLFVLYLSIYREENYKDDDNVLYNIKALKKKVEIVLGTKEEQFIYILELVKFEDRVEKYGIGSVKSFIFNLNKFLEKNFFNQVYSISKTRYVIISNEHIETKLDGVFFKNNVLINISEDSDRVVPAVGYFNIPNEFSTLTEILFAIYDNSFLRTRKKGSFVHITNDILLNKKRKISIEKAISTSFSRDSFPIVFLPMYCLKEDQFNAVHITSECIIEGEIIPKYEVDEVAANKDLVIDLEDDFISEVAKFVERYDLRSLNIKEVFVELSSKEFNKVSRVDSFIKAYKKHTNKPMSFINVYLSEVPDMEIVDTVITENIELLHKEGVQVYLNDYGTGYSTLNIISRFKFDGMKISSRICI